MEQIKSNKNGEMNNFSARSYNATQPFKQSPPHEDVPESDCDKEDRLECNELFSHFTADIIKENVTFTR